MSAADPAVPPPVAGGSYKQQKEAFVSGHSGGSVSEIYYVTALAPVALILWSALQARLSFFKPYGALAFAVDFLLNVGVILLAITLYAGSPFLLASLLAGPAVLVLTLPASLITQRAGRRRPRVPPPNAHSRVSGGSTVFKSSARSQSGKAEAALPLKAFLTHYRGAMVAVTCVAILAVDFRIFPRRFAKVETWGTSLMDMGVGSFVFSAGLAAARPVLKDRAAARSTPLARRLVYSLRHSLPLLALGVIRLLGVKGLDYAEHVTEYGVHWNFFFTLGLLPPLVAASQSALRLVPSYSGLALLLALAYEAVLGTTRLKAFILTAPRTDLLSKNREGVFSSVGYLAIFLAGMDVGMFVLPRAPKKGEAKGDGLGAALWRRNPLATKLAAWSAVWAALYLASTTYGYGAGLSVSRRLANLPYVLWVASFNTTQLLAFCLVDATFFPAADDARPDREVYGAASSRVLHALNRNGLAVFLAANLLTGLVNLTVPTLDVGPAAAMGILLAYTGLVAGLAVGLDVYDMSFKL